MLYTEEVWHGNRIDAFEAVKVISIAPGYGGNIWRLLETRLTRKQGRFQLMARYAQLHDLGGIAQS